MATRVKIKKKKATPVGFRARDFAHPDERRAKLVGLGVSAAIFLVILGVLAATPIRLPLMAAWAGWNLLAVIYFSLGANGAELRRLGGSAPAGLREAPKLTCEAVEKQSSAVGVAADALLGREAQELTTVGHVIVVPQDLPKRLGPAEMWALVAREIGHIKAGHVTLLSLCRRVEDEKSPLLRGLGLPLRWPIRALASWQWFAALTADRMSVLLTRDRRIVAAALLKQATARVEGITTAEIDEYLSRHGSLAAQSSEVTTHFKLGEVLREREGLLLRLRGIAQYAESEEYGLARQRLETAYRAAQKTDAGIPDPPGAPPGGEAA